MYMCTLFHVHHELSKILLQQEAHDCLIIINFLAIDERSTAKTKSQSQNWMTCKSMHNLSVQFCPTVQYILVVLNFLSSTLSHKYTNKEWKGYQFYKMLFVTKPDIFCIPSKPRMCKFPKTAWM